MYLPGGHGVSRSEHKDTELIAAIKDIMHYSDDEDDEDGVGTFLAEFNPINPITSISIQPNLQVSRCQLKTDLLPSGKLEGGATFIGQIKAQPAKKEFLFNARATERVSTTYGQALTFICGGSGDLRRLGIKTGEVVAYVAPPGGGAPAVLAFLSIGAQTTAAPLAASLTEPDVLDALDQFNAKHVILFEDVESPGCKDAFEKYTADGRAKLHTAKISGTDKPGQFEYTSKQIPNFESLPELLNPEDGHCLLLRTSGTTARPKGVPLQQGSLLNNGAIIAAAMQLTSSDVCYSVMPLFHIGGISASILCTLTSGGSVCCDGEPFDPGRMVDALATSNPQPTW